ncbi:hypothetical protein L227DRAFT_613367 [Lentinus tigrinus ALCF2SS1-6]|uniref:Uncharacterized protein n=1 Tax=Lentinus tigrinus ALCF2SS1-6 TaxID=1328759 RepID=A0A5C2S2D7_9APHY|nr:hypothetical protein L227DRAFT_613367 [Lentinus tigrinus ALCF2SS1-6]
MPVPIKLLTTSELLARQAIALQKRPEQLAMLRSTVFERRVAVAHRFKEEHKHVIKDFDFEQKSLNHKTRPHYIGPLVVIARNRGSAYILAELDGTVFDRLVAAFRLIPYLARTNPIHFQVGDLDLNAEHLQRLEDTQVTAEDLAELEGLANDDN